MRLVSVELEISVGSAFVADIQLVVPELTTKAERVSAHRLAEGIANPVGSVRLIEIQPVVADRKVALGKQHHRQRRWVSRCSGIDQAAGSGIGIEPVLTVAGNLRTGRWLRGSSRRAEKLDTRNVDRSAAEGLRVAHREELVTRRLCRWETWHVCNALIRLLVDGLNGSRIVVVIVERPVAGHMVDEIYPLSHVGIHDRSAVA